MPAEQRQNEFRQAVAEQGSIQLHFAKSFGFSNVARFVEGAFFAGRPNLENSVPSVAQGLCLISMVSLTEDIEVHVAFVIQSQLSELIARLQNMLASQDVELNHSVLGIVRPYGERNNNVNFYLAKDGRLYTFTISPRPYFDEELTQLLGNGIAVDNVFYAVYPPTLAVKNHPSMTGFLQDLRLLAGEEKVNELLVWQGTPSLLASMFQMPTAVGLPEISARIKALGGVYEPTVIQSFHTGLNFIPSKHFVILTGLSGTGKTSLVRRYSYAVHGMNNPNDDDPLFFLCPVRPDWTDPTGLTGHYDVFTSRFVVPDFLKAVLTANAFPDCPVFVCLDEMNLARVEYYFSDVLSAMETQLPITLHSHDVSVPSDLGILVPPRVNWPTNLYIVGTINIDETTHTISDKVLDRAQKIDLSQTTFQPLYDDLSAIDAHTAWSVTQCGPILTQVNDLLRPHGMGFGYRVVKEAILYHAFAVEGEDTAASVSALDQQLVNKILVKLKGTERQRELLNLLSQILNPYPSATNLLAQLTADLAEGWFQATK